MNTPALSVHDQQHRLPVAIISHAVWLSYRFGLRSQDVEELLFARGIIVTYEATRKGINKRAIAKLINCSPSPLSAWCAERDLRPRRALLGPQRCTRHDSRPLRRVVGQREAGDGDHICQHLLCEKRKSSDAFL